MTTVIAHPVANRQSTPVESYFCFVEQTSEETSKLFTNVRSVLLNNRVVFNESGKAIHGCLQVLRTTPSARAMYRRRHARLSAEAFTNPNDVEGEEDQTPATKDNVDENVFSPEQLEARDFANECVARVVGILMDQYPYRVELRYQAVISQSLLDSVELAACMLSHDDTKSAGIDLLLHVLDSTKHYYSSSNVSTTAYYNTRNSVVSLKKVLDTCIRVACQQGIFQTFALTLMAEGPLLEKEKEKKSQGETKEGGGGGDSSVTLSSSTAAAAPAPDYSWWRGAVQLTSLFQLVRDIGQPKNKIFLKEDNLLPSLISWATKIFLSIPAQLLKKENVDSVGEMLRMCEYASRQYEKQPKIPDDSSSSEEDVTENKHQLSPHFGYCFWLQVTTQYMKTGGLPQRLFSLDQIEPLDRRAQIAEPSPEFLRVHGAGNSMVDGIYTLAGAHKNVDKWYVVFYFVFVVCIFCYRLSSTVCCLFCFCFCFVFYLFFLVSHPVSVSVPFFLPSFLPSLSLPLSLSLLRINKFSSPLSLFFFPSTTTTKIIFFLSQVL